MDIEKLFDLSDEMDDLVKVVNQKYEGNDGMDPVDRGVLDVRESLEKILNSEGYTRIRCFVGDTVDPKFHRIVATHELDDFERFETEFKDERVFEVVRSGWVGKDGSVRRCHVVATV